MKKRIGDITLEEFAKICSKSVHCSVCPVRVFCGFVDENFDFNREVDLNGTDEN